MTGSTVPGGHRTSVSRLMWRGLTLACPACRRRGHFRWWILMEERCHHCGLEFNRIEGHWIGAIGLNTIVTFGVLLISLAVSVAITIPDIPVLPLTLANMGLCLVFPVVFHPVSRMLWTAVDVAMRPLEAHELDWSALDET